MRVLKGRDVYFTRPINFGLNFVVITGKKHVRIIIQKWRDQSNILALLLKKLKSKLEKCHVPL